MKWLIPTTIVFCLALIGLGIYFSIDRNSGGGPRIVVLSDVYNKRTELGYWQKGVGENPKVVVTEFSDFQCPACRQVYNMLEESVARTGTYTQLQYHHYPIPGHDKARIAAIAAESSGRQGKFWEMYDLIFARQLDWVDKSPYSFKKDLEGYAKDLGINVEQFKNDLNDNSVETYIDKDMEAGNKINLDATPTILINGQKLESIPRSTEEMVALIEKAATEQQN